MLRPACIVSLLFASTAMANGYVTPVTPMNYVIDLNNSNLRNEIGYVTPGFTWDLNSNYSGNITCPTAAVPRWSPVYYRGVYISNLPPVGDGYVRLNDFLDMRVQIWIDGNLDQYVQVPFDNRSNLLDNFWCNVGASFSSGNFRSGSAGIVSFRVRRPIINGIQISDRQIVEMYGRIGRTVETFNSIPMSRITISSALLYVPERCVINAGQTIEVEFGDIPTSGLDGNSFEKTVPLTFRCEGGAFEGNALKISLGISGRPASFNQDYLATSSNGYQGSQIINNLGIKFKQLNGDELKLRQFYPVNMQGNIGDWGFIAAPVSPQGANIPAGDFYATATIVAAFQ
ncbi:fimbrial protein [Aeromonas cavernicola]|uniref:Fimbrial protein n=1 Tax=Aeromonas cavernicola TaxID=1006623 RepID=A0A2H9U6G4_9GAMM|nr:fimbrial protein [Aeromonas cavernicola]PJG59647.1 fimbrial protein [Aeromonas cavernicola]